MLSILENSSRPFKTQTGDWWQMKKISSASSTKTILIFPSWPILKVGMDFLKLNEKKVCSFSDGCFKSTTRKAKLVQVEEVVLDSDMNPEDVSTLFKIISGIVHSAASQRHGCSIVVDLNESPIFMPGNSVVNPLNLKIMKIWNWPNLLPGGWCPAYRDGLEIAQICCLLDGDYVATENRARGARFNSALRFTAKHEKIMVIVVSSDSLVSVVMGGIVLDTKWRLKPSMICSGPVLLQR